MAIYNYATSCSIIFVIILISIRQLMDYILLPMRMPGRLLGVKVWRGEGGGMSDHFLVEARLKLVGGWRSAGRVEGVRNVLKLS